MSVARRQRAFGAMTGWWASALRALALVLALAVSLPAAGLAEDCAFHDGGRGRAGSALVVDSGHGPGEAADPGVAAHVHCGCHQVATLDGLPVTPAPDAARPGHLRTSDEPASITPNRPARPPRA